MSDIVVDSHRHEDDNEGIVSLFGTMTNSTVSRDLSLEVNNNK